MTWFWQLKHKYRAKVCCCSHMEKYRLDNDHETVTWQCPQWNLIKGCCYELATPWVHILTHVHRDNLETLLILDKLSNSAIPSDDLKKKKSTTNSRRVPIPTITTTFHPNLITRESPFIFQIHVLQCVFFISRNLIYDRSQRKFLHNFLLQCVV